MPLTKKHLPSVFLCAVIFAVVSMSLNGCRTEQPAQTATPSATFEAVTESMPEPTADPHQQLRGEFISYKGDYLWLLVSGGGYYYVNGSGFSLDLKPGDMVAVNYTLGNNPAQLDDVQEIRLVEKADWGVQLRVSEVTDTGLKLTIGIASGFPRSHTTDKVITLYQQDESGWTPLQKKSGKSFSPITTNCTGGAFFTVNWKTVYGALEPGQYRLTLPVSHEDETREFSVDFTVPGPVTEGGLVTGTDTVPMAPALAEELDKTVRYIISKRLVNPPQHNDKTMEQIRQSENTGFLDQPTTTLPEGKTFQLITESHSILEYRREGDLHIFSIAALCRGYNNRQLEDSCLCSMKLTIRENTDGTYTATSCMIPTLLSKQADTEMLFSPETARRLLEDQQLRDTLRQACDRQLTFQTLEVKGFGQTFQAGSTEATLIENAIKAGKKLKKAYEDSYVSTLYVGDTVYYFYFKKGIIHNAIDNIYIQLTKEGTETVSAVFQAAGQQ